MTAQSTVTEVAAISRGQLQNSQLHSTGRPSRYKGTPRFCALLSQISLDVENMANEGYHNLTRFLKDGRKCWVKQGDLFILILQDKVVVIRVALYHLEKSGDHNDIESRMFG